MHRRRLLACAAALPFASLLVPASAAPREIALGTLPSSEPADLRSPVDFAVAANAIVHVLTRQLQLPMPAYTMEIHTEPAEFEAALVQHLKLKPDVARSAAGFAKAAVGNRRVLVNVPAMATIPWAEQVVTLSHEVAHASQLDLAGRTALNRHQWLVEGFAEWIGFRVAQELGVVDLAAARVEMAQKVRAVRQGAGTAPLNQMDAMDQWVRVRQAKGFDATYSVAFLAVDLLVQRRGYPALLEYFRRFRQSNDADAHFAAAFGEELPRFQAALDAWLDKPAS